MKIYKAIEATDVKLCITLHLDSPQVPTVELSWLHEPPGGPGDIESTTDIEEIVEIISPLVPGQIKQIADRLTKKVKR